MLLSYLQLFHDLESKKFDPESKRFGPESKKFGNYLDNRFELQGPDLKSKPTTSLQATKYRRQEVVGGSSADASSLQQPGLLKTHVVRSLVIPWVFGPGTAGGWRTQTSDCWR